MSKYARRPYRERIALEADDLIKAIHKGEVEIVEPEVAVARPGEYDQELQKQQAIAEVLGIGRTQADADRAYELLRLGMDAPYGIREGREIQGRGIAGNFQDDSTIRIHRNNLTMADPLISSSVKNNEVIDGYTGLMTEYLSPEGEQALFKLWKAEQEADPYRKNQNTPEHFNRALQEYYGQQALRLAGNTPVLDKNRSYNVTLNKNRNHPNSTLGTDRLIETNASILGGDVGNPAGDYRYNTPDGQLGVGDYQGADYKRGERPLEAEIRLQLIKGSKMSPRQRSQFAGNIRAAAAGVADIDDALRIMKSKGQLPELVMEEIKQNKPSRTGRTSGMRAGKMMSDAPFMGSMNFNDQHQYSHVLYGLQNSDNLSVLGQGGGVPQSYYNVPTEKARRFMASNPAEIRTGADGSAFMAPSLQQLLDAGVATDMLRAYPQVRQLL